MRRDRAVFRARPAVAGMVRARRLAVAVLVAAALGGAGCGDRDDPGPDRQERVEQAFERYADEAVGKERVSAAAPNRHLLAGSDRLAGGTEVTLWVSDPATGSPVDARCYYLDLEDRGGWVSGFGGCGGADDQVTLNRNSEIVFGTVGRWPASTVRISRGGPPTDVTVTGGWFLVPQSLTGEADGSYSIVLVGADGGTLCVVRNLTPPASVTPVT
ncbi:hypothetical protein OG792_17560 [Micromonospora sp. NBC_01699]|uniref:hypothetical protein n=1 Tax=Micromonospora sp. NBC_01699 TaxID=2975984 RepID=UPI002E2FD770|nr:hypothetical protein [Micromonospora sp. NBC_01699]